jgi:hypothetical protein
MSPEARLEKGQTVLGPAQEKEEYVMDSILSKTLRAVSEIRCFGMQFKGNPGAMAI